MKNILILGPDLLYSFSRQVSNLIRFRITKNGEKVEFAELDFGDEKTRNDAYNEHELNALPFDDAQKIFRAIIRTILAEQVLDEEIRNKLQNILQTEIKHDEDTKAIDEFNKINFPENFIIKIKNNSLKNPQDIEVYRGAVGNDGLEEICQEVAKELEQESKLFLMVNAHGSPDQSIWIAQGEKPLNIHPSELIKKIFIEKQEKPVLLDLYTCSAGAGIETRDERDINLGKYSANLPNSSTAILNGGKKVILMSFLQYLMDGLQKERAKNPDINDDFSIFLYKIFQSPNTTKLIHKDADGNIHTYKYSFIKPKSSEDVSKEKIKEHVASEMNRFVEWCKEKGLGDSEKLSSLAEEYTQRLEEKHLQNLGDMALSLEIYRGRVDYAKCYEDPKHGYRFTNTPLIPIDRNSEEEISSESRKLNSLSLINNLMGWATFKDKFEKEGDTSKKDKYLENMNLLQEAMEYNIEKGINPHHIGKSGSPLLMMACFYGNDKIAELLLEKGADPNSKSKKSTNPKLTTLRVALSKGNLEITRMLVQSPKLSISREELGEAIDENEKSRTQKTQIMKLFDDLHPHEKVHPQQESQLSNELKTFQH